jgi:hypothetical protein
MVVVRQSVSANAEADGVKFSEGLSARFLVERRMTHLGCEETSWLRG